MAIITDRVAAARAGSSNTVIARVTSGWAVMGDPQIMPGYCLLLPDPVVPSLNHLGAEARAAFLSDMARIGDAILATTGAARINYEILGNADPELHAHIVPRYSDEPADLRTKPVWFYDWQNGPKFSVEQHGDLQARIRDALAQVS